MTRMKRLERAQTRLGAYALQQPLVESEAARDYLASFDDGGGTPKYCVVRSVIADISRVESFAELFEDAVRLATQLDHPHLVSVLDHGHQDGEFFVATEYTPGTTLRSIQDRLRDEGKQLPLPCVLSVGLALTSALHRLEAGSNGPTQPLIHGDLTLDRVVVSTTGDIKLGDFSVEHAIRSVRAYGGSRGEGGARGRLARGCGHLPPEQLLNDRLDARTDQYGLGAVLFELLAGHSPYERHDLASTVAAVLGGARPDLRTLVQLPDDVAAVIDRTLARRAEDRYPSPALLYADLERISARFDMTSALGLLAGIARGLQPVQIENTPVINLTEAVVESTRADVEIEAALASPTAAPIEAPGTGHFDALSAVRSTSVAQAAPADEGEADSGVATMVWMTLVTAAVVASIFLWVWILSN